MRTDWLRALFVLLSIIFGRSMASGQVVHRSVALSGEAAPGGAGASFRTFANPVINAAGDVAFQANLSGPTTEVVPHGVWTSTRAGLRPVALAGWGAPGVEGARFRTPSTPNILTNDGVTLFYGQLVEEGGITFDNGYGIWSGTPDDLHLYARRGDPAPALPPGVNYSLFFANPHASGLTGFSASLGGPAVNASNDSAAWVGSMPSPGALQLIARGGHTAPGLPDGWRFRNVGTPLVNAAGHVVLPAVATRAQSGVPDVQGFWAGPPTDLHPMVMSGTLAPGTSGRTFDWFSGPRFNDAGCVAFMANLHADFDAQRLSDTGIWAARVSSATGSDLVEVALEGHQAPGFEAGVVFSGSAPGDHTSYDPFKPPTLGGGGHVTFAGTVHGGGIDFDHNDGIWRSDPIGDHGAPPPRLTLIAREGDHPPGTPEGTRFAGIHAGDDLIPAFESPLINVSGQIAFEALTSGPLGTFGRGIWLTDAFGELHLVAHTGLGFEVSPGEVRVVELLKLHAGGSSIDGQLAALNDTAELAFAVQFTDGSEGVFIASVPEPCHALTVLASAALAAGRTTPRRRSEVRNLRPRI